MIKANSGLDLPSSTPREGLTNERQAVSLTNKDSGVIKHFNSMKAAALYLQVSSTRISNYLKNNECSVTNEQVSTINGYYITKIDCLDSAKRNSKAIEVTNIQTKEVTRYP